MATGIAIVAAVAGAAVSAYGAVQQGKAQQQSDEFNAKVQRNNAIAAAQNAAAAKQQAALEASRTRRDNIRMLGAQTAAFAKSGVQITGSAQDVMFDSAVEGEMDALLQLYRGDLGAREHKQQALDFEHGAQQSELSGSAARRSGYIQAGSSLLSGAGSAAGVKIRSNTIKKNT